jgi:hypothetical protein
VQHVEQTKPKASDVLIWVYGAKVNRTASEILWSKPFITDFACKFRPVVDRHYLLKEIAAALN